MGDCLELDGYRVREAGDAIAALARIKEGMPDCVLLDVMMPGMSGIKLLERLREDPATVRLPVLMLTAATDEATTWAGWSLGVSCYVPKPFDVDHLLDWVGRLCRPAPAAPAVRPVFDLDAPEVDELAVQPEPACDGAGRTPGAAERDGQRPA